MKSQSLNFRTLNLTSARDKLAEGEVASALNIDFGREVGAAVVRRGTSPIYAGSTRISHPNVRTIARHYIDPYSIGSSKWYTSTATATYRDLTQIGSGGEHVPMVQFKEWMIISTEAGGIMDDGTTTIPWIGHAPSTAPSVSVENAPLYQPAGVWTAQQVTTWTPAGDGNGGVAEGTDKIVIQFTPSNGNFDLAEDSIFYIDISLSNTDVVVTQEWSIGAPDFKNVMRAQCVPGQPTALFANPALVVDIANASLEERERMLEEMRMHAKMPSTALTLSPNVYGVWAVQRPMFEMSSSVAADWSNIGAVRYIVEGTGDMMVGIRNLAVSNTTGYPLNDPSSGYVWWETWVTKKDGYVSRESAPSPPSARKPVQAARATITLPVTPPASYGYTHRRIYRQGGYMRDAYLVAEVPIATTTVIDAKSDVDALLGNVRMVRDIYSNQEFGGYATCFSEPFNGRLVFGFENRIWWSEPNMPGMVRRTSWAEVSHAGDHVQAIVNWGPILVVINRDSIYEVDGELRVQRSNSPRGSKAKKVPCSTPYGIPILDYDGLHFYQPGASNIIQYDWIQRAVGNLSPLLNTYYINNSFAVWADNRLYLAIPTQSSSPDTILVFDFVHQTTSLWKYPYAITAGYWNQVDNELILGTPHGLVNGNSRFSDNDWTPTAELPVTWNFETGLWTFVPESRLMNIGVDWRGSASVEIAANGGPYTTILSSSGPRRRELPTASGTLYNTVSFRFSGQGPGAVYALEWDAYDEVPKVLFARSPYARFDTDMRLNAVTVHADALSSNVTVRVYVNGSVVHTTTITGDGPTGYTITIPETVGASAFVELESTTPFRFYELRFHGEPEPAVVTRLRVDEKIYEQEQEFKAWAANMDCLGNTVTVSIYIDATLITTFQVSGQGRKGYVQALPASGPVHPMGRHIWAEYSGGPFRHYATWYEVKAEPSRLHHFRTNPDMRGEEHEWKAFSYVLEGTATAKVYIDGAEVLQKSVSGAGVEALPPSTFGRTAYVVYSSSAPFKHYGTTFTTRAEPHRLTSFRTDPDMRGEEHEWRTISYVLEGSATAEVYIDGVLVTTFTATGAGVQALPPLTYGRTAYVIYTSSTPFKHYGTSWGAEVEPPRVTSWVYTHEPLPSTARLKTLVSVLNCLGGTVTAQVEVDGVVVKTVELTGGGRTTYNTALDVSGASVRVFYSAATPFKHYSSVVELAPEPFLKDEWFFRFMRVGGFVSFVYPRRYNLDVEGEGTVTVEWTNQDGVFHTTTHTIHGRTYLTWMPFPANVASTLLKCRITSSTPFRVWAVSMDVEYNMPTRTARTTIRGTPDAEV